METIALYTYCKSSAAYRIRIALHYKEIPYHAHYVSLINNGGENYSPEYTSMNPQAMVPTLKVAEETLTQSMAILEYLEETFSDPPLLPQSPIARATARSYAQMVACDIHPLNNLRVLQYLEDPLQQSQDNRTTWYQHWIYEGFDAMERRLTTNALTGDYCIGNHPSVADVCLIPQVYNALRYHCEMTRFPTIKRIYDHCLTLDAFKSAAPENQDDYTQSVLNLGLSY